MAVIGADVATLTFPAVTVKTAVVAPFTIVTVAGTVAARVFELSRTAATPALPAGSEIVIVPVAVCPLVIEAGFTVSDVIATGGYTFR
jgi:hypothetical protein